MHCIEILSVEHITDPVKLSTGIRQGCPLSAYLFILFREILVIKIRTGSLVINGLQSKACFCEDDVNPSMSMQMISLWRHFSLSQVVVSSLSGSY